MGIVSSLFAKPVRKALTKSVTKQADDVVPKIASEIAEPAVTDAPLPTKSLVTKKARGSTSKPVIKEEPVVAPQDDVDTGVNFDPLFKDEEAVTPPVVDDAFIPPKVDRIEDFGVEPEPIADSGIDAFEALGLSTEKKEAWRKQNKASQRSGLLPEIEEAAQKLFEGKLKPEEFRKLSAEKQPIVPLDKVPDVPSFTEIASALKDTQVNKGIVGLNMKIPPGKRVSSRLDIPAYNDYNTWVVSIHEGSTNSGAPIGYAKTAVLKNVEFMSDPKVALDIARRKPLGSGGRMGKATIARIYGDYVPHDPDAAKAYAEKIFNNPEWTQVGMNPYRASYFYDKTDNMPVVSADEIVQIGPLVMAKNVKKTKPDDAIFRVNKKDDASPTFAKGGVVKNEMNKLFAEGGVMQEGGTVDPVSGNDVPPGAMAEEVRDDIPAQLSEGEFVFPADVVRFYGLEKLMMMRDKAKKGLQRMNEIGQMGNAEEVPDGEALFGGEGMDDDAFSSEIDSIMAEDSGGETREYAKGGDVRKYAPGGYVGGEENKQLYRDAPIKGFEMVPMTNDAGQTIYIPFINGVAQLSIPSGYKVKKADDVTKVDDKTTTDATTTTADTSGAGGDSGDIDDSGGGGGNTDGTAPGGGQGISNAAISAGLAAMSFGQSTLGKGISAILGIPLSTMADIGGTAVVDLQIDAIGKSFDAMNDAQNSNLAGQIGTVSDESGNISTISNQSITDAFDLANFGITSEGLSAENAANAAAVADQGNVAEGGSMAAEANNAAQGIGSVGDASDPSGSVGGGGSEGSVGDTSGGYGEDAGFGLAKGGFVSKPKKNKVKPKGLAGRR